MGHDLSTLAEATIAVALRTLEPQVPCAVIALGRLGGDSLSYASDLDIVFVYDGDDQRARDEGDRLAKGLLRLVNGTSPAERIFEIDTTLRPEGTQGAVARSLGAYRAYLDRWASLWERQAYLRARPVAGDDDVGIGVHGAWSTRSCGRTDCLARRSGRSAAPRPASSRNGSRPTRTPGSTSSWAAVRSPTSSGPPSSSSSATASARPGRSRP